MIVQEAAVVGKTILIVDENAASRNFLANTFLEKQFKVTEASSGKEALIIAWRDEPDLILFDPVFLISRTRNSFKNCASIPVQKRPLLLRFPVIRAQPARRSA